MKYSLKTKLSFVIAIVVLITVALISFLSNVLIGEQFNRYILRQQEEKKEELVSLLSRQYHPDTDTWNIDYVHTVGMSALYEGYIIKVYDRENAPVWDAETHDMSLCARVMEDISERMQEKQPMNHGEFTSRTYDLTKNGAPVGSVSIRYFGPYFLSENDFRFLDALNIVLLSIGVFSLLLSVFLGFLLARRISRPILKTVAVAGKIADGSYGERIDEKTRTKEIDMLIGSINHLAFSLENQESLRRQLTEDVSHELRTPIAILQSHIEAMAEGVWEPTKERLESCSDEIKRLGSLVSDLEKLQKIESGRVSLQLSEVSLPDIVRKAAKSFDAALREKNLTVSVGGSCSGISADGDRIGQVAVNLLSNAVKYAKDGGRIGITLFETDHSAGFRIADDGAGIPENELPFIFERFYRADKSRNRNTGGSGLGLAIVRSIVEAHGGRISVKSRVDHGTCFEITLPKKQDS